MLENCIQQQGNVTKSWTALETIGLKRSSLLHSCHISKGAFISSLVAEHCKNTAKKNTVKTLLWTLYESKAFFLHKNQKTTIGMQNKTLKLSQI